MTTVKVSPPTMAYAVFTYLLVAPLFLFVAAVIWAEKVSGVWYLCTDSLGVFDFFPPWVHAVAGDVYYKPAWMVYSLWFAFVLGALLIPAAGLWGLYHLFGNQEE